MNQSDVTAISEEQSVSMMSRSQLPLLNLVRQILKALDYNMKPMRKSAGYNENGQKKYNRFFKIEKTKKLPKKLNLNIENLNNEKMT